MRRRRLAALLLALLSVQSVRAGLLPERRRSQFAEEPGYAVVPYAYSLPGIGVGYGLLGAATNIGRSCADAAGTLFLGDADGQAASFDQLYIVPRRLMLDAGAARLGRASLQSFARRGMGSGKDDYSLAEFGDLFFGGARLTATADDRRFEAWAGYYAGTAALRSLRDRRGEVIAPSATAARVQTTTLVLGLRADLTDDWVDPRRGLRLEPSVWRSPRRGSGPDFYFTDLSATGYLPVGRRSTLALNMLKSDARVLSRGQTDPAALQREQGLDCGAIPDAAAQGRCNDYISTLAAQNAYGTAAELGGFNRLRAYPGGRFKGAHSAFLGSELRWNLTDTVKPFDIVIMKDIRTAFQVAFFYELGTVADLESQLWRRTRYACGAGVRLVTASGLVYRVDAAAGDEGWQPSIFFQYPWEL